MITESISVILLWHKDDGPEAIIVAGHAAIGCACWVQDVQLVCNAVEIADQTE